MSPPVEAVLSRAWVAQMMQTLFVSLNEASKSGLTSQTLSRLCSSGSKGCGTCQCVFDQLTMQTAAPDGIITGESSKLRLAWANRAQPEKIAGPNSAIARIQPD